MVPERLERPVGGTDRRVEVHLLEGSPDLYDRPLEVACCVFLRPEQRFDSREALMAQIQEDVRQAAVKLAALPVGMRGEGLDRVGRRR